MSLLLLISNCHYIIVRILIYAMIKVVSLNTSHHFERSTGLSPLFIPGTNACTATHDSRFFVFRSFVCTTRPFGLQGAMQALHSRYNALANDTCRVLPPCTKPPLQKSLHLSFSSEAVAISFYWEPSGRQLWAFCTCHYMYKEV